MAARGGRGIFEICKLERKGKGGSNSNALSNSIFDQKRDFISRLTSEERHFFFFLGIYLFFFREFKPKNE